jgi:hypothetical protein
VRAVEEVARLARLRHEARERELELAEEEQQAMLLDAARQVVDSDNESSDDEGGLEILFKNPSLSAYGRR